MIKSFHKFTSIESPEILKMKKQIANILEEQHEMKGDIQYILCQLDYLTSMISMRKLVDDTWSVNTPSIRPDSSIPSTRTSSPISLGNVDFDVCDTFDNEPGD